MQILWRKFQFNLKKNTKTQISSSSCFNFQFLELIAHWHLAWGRQKVEKRIKKNWSQTPLTLIRWRVRSIALYNNNWDFIIRTVSLHLYREICLSFPKTINHFFMHRHTIINCDCYRYRAPLNGQDFLLLWKTCFFFRSLARALTNDDWGKKK